ncbi:MAG TPA: DUF2059 domain-containing protein [Devosia sp.]
MFVRALAIALCLAAAPLPTLAVTPAVAPAETVAPMTTEELMKATALDQLFSTFAETIAASPEQQGLPLPEDFAETWKETSFAVFRPDEMHGALAKAFADRFDAAELTELAAFYRSDFGKRVSAIEAAIQVMSVDEQLAARDEGFAALDAADPESKRIKQIDEIMVLVSAEVGRTMLGQAMRAMMVSMAMSGAGGDIEVPWSEIDAQLAMMLPGLEQEVAATQRALMAYAYKDLSDDELDQYIAFLRTDVSKKFYAVLGYSVGIIMEKSMGKFGQELAYRLNRVNV